MINIPNIPVDTVVGQVAAVLSAFWPLVAIVAGAGIGLWVFRKVLSSFTGRR